MCWFLTLKYIATAAVHQISLHEAPEPLHELGNLPRAYIYKVMGSKWVKY